MTGRVGPKGQVVIPKEIRDRAQLHPGDEVEFEFRDDQVVIVARRDGDRLGGRFAASGMAARLLEDRAREPRRASVSIRGRSSPGSTVKSRRYRA